MQLKFWFGCVNTYDTIHIYKNSSKLKNKTEMSTVKFDIEKFDRRINFGLWQIQVKDLLIQHGLHKALKGKSTIVFGTDSEKSSTTGNDDWEELDLRVASAIKLCLAKNILANVHGMSTAKGLWEKLEELYQAKSISNRLYLKE